LPGQFGPEQGAQLLHNIHAGGAIAKTIKVMKSGNNFLLQKMGEMAADINKINNRIAKLEAKQG